MDSLSSGAADKLVGEATTVLPEIYRDALQPAAREVGTVVGRAVRVALSPVRALVWSWEHAEQWLERSVAERFERRDVSPERVKTPPPQITAGVIRGVQAAGPESDGTLRDMFANLLATAMEAGTPARAHPAFAEILSQLSPEEARLLQLLGRRTPSPVVQSVVVTWVDDIFPVAGERIAEARPVPAELGISDDPDLIQSFWDNLQRLGLCRFESETFDAASLGTANETDPPEIPDPKQRWLMARPYLRQYGVPEVGRALGSFEQSIEVFTAQQRPEGFVLNPGKRAAMFCGLVWATSFGRQLLRAVCDPEEIGSLSGP